MIVSLLNVWSAPSGPASTAYRTHCCYCHVQRALRSAVNENAQWGVLPARPTRAHFFRHAQAWIGQDEIPHRACRHSALLVTLFGPIQACGGQAKIPKNTACRQFALRVLVHIIINVTIDGASLTGKQRLSPLLILFSVVRKAILATPIRREAIRPASTLRYTEMLSCLAQSSPSCK